METPVAIVAPAEPKQNKCRHTNNYANQIEISVQNYATLEARCEGQGRFKLIPHGSAILY